VDQGQEEVGEVEGGEAEEVVLQEKRTGEEGGSLMDLVRPLPLDSVLIRQRRSKSSSLRLSGRLKPASMTKTLAVTLPLSGTEVRSMTDL
jgi:hypothetical protein